MTLIMKSEPVSFVASRSLFAIFFVSFRLVTDNLLFIEFKIKIERVWIIRTEKDFIIYLLIYYAYPWPQNQGSAVHGTESGL